MAEQDMNGYTNLGANIHQGCFIFWPIMIYWSLVAIVFGDRGMIGKKFINKLYADNNIEVSKIGIEYTMKEVIEMLTENYLVG